jgi:ABC-type enterobactin transport system permease subunit
MARTSEPTWRSRALPLILTAVVVGAALGFAFT